MAKRLQVILRDREYRGIQRMTSWRGVSPAEWVRQALERACRRESIGDVGKKLEAIRAAARHEYPVTDTDHMLEEIKQGYGSHL